MALVTRVVTNVGSPLYTPEGVLLANKTVKFTLVDSTDTPSPIFDATTGERVVGVVTATTDASGEFSINLWPNDRGTTNTKYICSVTYPGERSFSSIVPSGGAPLTWLDFKLAGATLTPIQITALDAHIADATAAHTASAISNTPAGNISATTVQAAIDELESEKLSTTGVGSDMTLARIAGSTYSTIQHWRNNMASAGIVSGGVMTDAGGATINVTGGSCAIRPTISHLSTLYFADFPANNGIAIPTNTIRYVGVEYNAGSPIIAIRATDDFDYMTNFPLGVVTNEAGTLHLHIADRHDIADADSHVAERFEHTASFARDEVTGGLILGEIGTRNITMSAGAMWQKLVKLTIAAFNSSTGGTFDIYYRDGASGFTKVAAATQWPNTQYDNGTGTLATLGNNKYGTLWFYLEADDSDIIMLYGRAEHGSIAAAEAEVPPATVPNRVTAGARIIGKLVFQKSAATAASVSSVFTTTFSTNGTSTHSNLANLDYASAGHTGFVADATKGVANGVASLDANALIPIAQLPPAAVERLVVVADQAARYALTTTTVQNGDTVKQTDTGEMWFVVDEANLGNSAGYAVYTAGTASAVAVGGITGLGTGVATALTTPTIANFNSMLSDGDFATGGGTATGTNTGDDAVNSLYSGLAASKLDASLVSAAALTVLDDATVSAMVDTLGGAAATGSGGLVRATSPSLVTPAIGTPTSGDLRNCSMAVAPAIGGTTPATGAFTTLNASGSVTVSAASGNTLLLSSSATNPVQIYCTKAGNDGNPGARIDAYKSRGTIASPAIINAGDWISGRFFYAYDGTGYTSSGYESVIVNSVGSGDIRSTWSLNLKGVGSISEVISVSSSTGLAVTGAISATTIKTDGYTVSTLPAGATGDRAYVTDATNPTYLGALTGGGAVVCPVFKNASAWVSA